MSSGTGSDLFYDGISVMDIKTGWKDEAYRTITFDGEQTVSKVFYEWLTENAVNAESYTCWIINEDADLASLGNETYDVSMNLDGISKTGIRYEQTENSGILYFGSSSTNKVCTVLDGVNKWSAKWYRYVIINTPLSTVENGHKLNKWLIKNAEKVVIPSDFFSSERTFNSSLYGYPEATEIEMPFRSGAANKIKISSSDKTYTTSGGYTALRISKSNTSVTKMEYYDEYAKNEYGDRALIYAPMFESGSWVNENVRLLQMNSTTDVVMFNNGLYIAYQWWKWLEQNTIPGNPEGLSYGGQI